MRPQPSPPHNDDQIVFVCDDWMHALVIGVESSRQQPIVSVYATVMTQSPPGKMKLWWRITQAWQTFWSGQPYAETVYFEGRQDLVKIRDAVDTALSYYDDAITSTQRHAQ